MMRALRELAPDVHIQAFTASEIAHFARISGKSVPEVLQELKDAGLGSLPGGGAEVFSGRVRDLICERKISGQQWLDVHARGARGRPQVQRDDALRARRGAGRARGPHGPPARAPGRHRRLQRLHPALVPAGQHRAQRAARARPASTTSRCSPSAASCSTTSATSRRSGSTSASSWRRSRSCSGSTTSTARWWRRRSATPPASTPAQELSKAELVRVIRAAGRVPVERDTLYNVVRRYDDGDRAGRGRRGGAPRPCASGASSSSTASRSTTTSRRSSRRAACSADDRRGLPRRRSTSMLVDGAIDVALPSSIAFARHAGGADAAAAGLDQLVRRRRLDPAVRARAAAATSARVALTEKSATSICLLKVLVPGVGHRPRVRAAPRAALARCSTDFDAPAADRRRGAAPAARRGVPAPLRPRRRVEERHRPADGLRRLRRAPRLRGRAAAAAAAAVGAALLASRDRCAAQPARDGRRRGPALRLQPGRT